MTTITSDASFYLSSKDNRLVCENGKPFDMGSYSRFKYGYTPTATRYGYALAELFIEHYGQYADSEQRLLVTSAPYKFLATASHAVATAFMDVLNCYRVKRGLEPAMMLHLIRFKVGTDRYAMAGPEERKKTFTQAPRHVDTGLVRGANVVAIDDVCVTGATRDRVQELVLPAQPVALCFLHVATLDKTWAQANASIEDIMNKSFQTTLDTIERDIENNEFQLNSRVFRMIMESDDYDRLYEFLARRTDECLTQMYQALTWGTVEMYGRHPAGAKALEQVIVDRELSLARFL